MGHLQTLREKKYRANEMKKKKKYHIKSSAHNHVTFIA